MYSMDDHAKISDSAYFNSSSSNSQSRGSISSKSTHSGSSGSSGYCGKPSTLSSKLESLKKDKDGKRKKSHLLEMTVTAKHTVVECVPPNLISHCNATKEDINAALKTPALVIALPEKPVANLDYTSSDLNRHKYEAQTSSMQAITSENIELNCQVANTDSAGFVCAISMHDGAVMYATHNLTTNLGYPKDMWIGRSFIDFVHPKDRNTFASQITNGLAVPKIINGIESKVQQSGVRDCIMACRMRLYRKLNAGFVVSDAELPFKHFVLNFSLKDTTDDDDKIVYLIIQASPIISEYKALSEYKSDSPQFVIRHSATGMLEYIDIESTAYLGYLPQDLQNKDVLLMYHNDDLAYLNTIYEQIVKANGVVKSKPFRMLAQNGCYVKLESEWTSFINPWSMKLEFVVGKHRVLEGPANPDVFLSAPLPKPLINTKQNRIKIKLAEIHRDNILCILQDVRTKPGATSKQQISKRSHELAVIMKNLLDEQSKLENGNESDYNSNERDSVILGGISPHHEYNDSKWRNESPLSYNQINYNENLQRFFDSHENVSFDEGNTVIATPKESPSTCLPALSPLAQDSDSSSSDSSSARMSIRRIPANVDDQSLRLTETLLTKHNTDMEKKLVNRRKRFSFRGAKAAEARQKKREHLARCNAAYQPTMAGAAYESAERSRGVKRSSRKLEVEIESKYHCSQSRQIRRRQTIAARDTIITPLGTTHTATHYTYQDVSMQSYEEANRQPMHHIPDILPAHYPEPSNSGTSESHIPPVLPNFAIQYSQHQAHYMATTEVSQQKPHPATNTMPWFYPPVYGPNTYAHNVSYNVQQQMMSQTVAIGNANSRGVSNEGYLQACKSTPLMPPKSVGRAASLATKLAGALVATRTFVIPSSGLSIASKRSTQIISPKLHRLEVLKSSGTSNQSGQTNDETLDRTDVESSFSSSYSSFYSSFLKSDSCSADDSDAKMSGFGSCRKSVSSDTQCYSYEAQETNSPPEATMDPQWMTQVHVSPDLVYMYKVPSKTKEEVLQTDQDIIDDVEQYSMVNDQLGQLYADLQLDGVPARLNLDEGITSSSSSGEETSSSTGYVKLPSRRRRDNSRLQMIYEENAPLPAPARTNKDSNQAEFT